MSALRPGCLQGFICVEGTHGAPAGLMWGKVQAIESLHAEDTCPKQVFEDCKSTHYRRALPEGVERRVVVARGRRRRRVLDTARAGRVLQRGQRLGGVGACR